MGRGVHDRHTVFFILPHGIGWPGPWGSLWCEVALLKFVDTTHGWGTDPISVAFAPGHPLGPRSTWPHSPHHIRKGTIL
jgi:hypothetical protein